MLRLVNKAKYIFLPPFIGSIILTGIAYYDEKFKETSDLEPCEIFTLSTTDFIIILIVLTIIGGVIQLTIVEQIFRKININQFIHWIILGTCLSILLAVGFAFLLWAEQLGIKDLINSFAVGLILSAIYVTANLLTVKTLKNKNGI
ncbi:MAG: hypothetical protein ACNS60_12095 [Candidatus Cyclobacteriaceae bacterium M2_1C_046]